MKKVIPILILFIVIGPIVYAFDPLPTTIVGHNLSNETINHGEVVTYKAISTGFLSTKASLAIKKNPGNSTGGAIGVSVQTCMNNTLCAVAIEGIVPVMIDPVISKNNATVAGEAVYAGRTAGRVTRLTMNRTGAEIIGYILVNTSNATPGHRVLLRIGRRN